MKALSSPNNDPHSSKKRTASSSTKRENDFSKEKATSSSTKKEDDSSAPNTTSFSAKMHNNFLLKHSRPFPRFTSLSLHKIPSFVKVGALSCLTLGVGSYAGLHSAQSTHSSEIRQILSSSDNWGLSFQEEGTRPIGNASIEELSEYNAYFAKDTDEKILYLTFDAGYENGNIEKILDTLKAENVPAAFFILEHLAEANTELVCRMFDEGHTVCNHTAVHKDMTKIGSFDAFKSELERMENCCLEKTGHSLSYYYRPPEGKVSEESLEWADELGYKTIMWSYAYADWDNNNQMSEEAAIEKVISGTHNGEVLLLHPTSETNAKILPVLIQKWREMGYRFGTLDELTGDGDVS